MTPCLATLQRADASLWRAAQLVAHRLRVSSAWRIGRRVTSLKLKAALDWLAPPNPEDVGFPSEAIGFSPVPLGSFGFPSIVVASSNDRYGSLEFARACASGWGSRFVNIGAASHINSESGLGDWPEGWTLYQELTV